MCAFAGQVRDALLTINQMFAAGSAGSATNHDTPIRLVSTH